MSVDVKRVRRLKFNLDYNVTCRKISEYLVGQEHENRFCISFDDQGDRWTEVDRDTVTKVMEQLDETKRKVDEFIKTIPTIPLSWLQELNKEVNREIARRI